MTREQEHPQAEEARDPVSQRSTVDEGYGLYGPPPRNRDLFSKALSASDLVKGWAFVESPGQSWGSRAPPSPLGMPAAKEG